MKFSITDISPSLCASLSESSAGSMHGLRSGKQDRASRRPWPASLAAPIPTVTNPKTPWTNDEMKEHTQEKWIWVFHGDSASFCSAAFDDKALALDWIKREAVSGMLTRMPLNMSAYAWATREGHFTPKREDQKTPAFMQRFTSASLEHEHYKDGKES